MSGNEREQTGMNGNAAASETGINGNIPFRVFPFIPGAGHSRSREAGDDICTLHLTLEQYEDERRRYGRRRLWGWDRIVVDGVVVKEVRR